MRAIVTGGSGFLGGHVISQLLSGGHDVHALARSAPAADRVRALGAESVSGDLDDPSSVDHAFSAAAAAGADTLVNLASLGFGHAPTIVAAAEEAGLTRAVFVSTAGVYTTLNPRSRAVREAAEETIRASGLRWTVVRPTMIYGTAGDRNMSRLLRMLRRAPAMPLPAGGRGLQQPVHVDDLAWAVIAAVRSDDAVGRTYDVAGPAPLALREVVEQAALAAGRTVRLVSVPMGPAVAAARAYQRLSRRPALKAEQLERLAEDKAVDISAAVQDLGYRPRSFLDGIRQEAALVP